MMIMAGVGISNKLVSRENELQKLLEILEDVLAGVSRTVFINGELGIGKTSLVDVIMDEANDKGFLVLKGICSPDDFTPYRPLQEAWRDSGNPSLEKLGFEKSEEPFDDKNMLDASKNAAFYETSQNLKEVSADKPVLVVLEDMHWADSGTLNLFHYLADRLENSPILFVGTYCPGDAVPGSGFIEMKRQMSRKNLFTEIELGPLDVESTRSLLKLLTGMEDVPIEFVDKVHEDSEGNPLFIKEGIIQMRDEGLLFDEDGSFIYNGFELPMLIQDVIEKRIFRLDDRSRDILQMGSVIGRRIPYGLLNSIYDGSELELLDSIDGLVDNRLWEEGAEGEFYFSHSMIKQIVYDGIGRWIEKKRYHSRVADGIAKEYRGNLEVRYQDLARHFREAERFSESLEYYTRAGKSAEEVYSHEDALELYEKALSLTEKLDDVEEKAWILERMAEVKRLMGEYSSTRGYLYDALQVVSEHDKSQCLYRKIAETLQEQGEYESAYELVERLVTGKEETTESSRLKGVQGWSLMFMGRYSEAQEVFEEEKELAEKLGGGKEIGRAFHNLGTISLRMGDYESASKYLSKAMEIREEIDDIKGLSKSLNNLAALNSFIGELDKAVSQYRECLSLYKEMRNEPTVGKILNNIGVIHYKRGELSEAAEDLHEGLEIAKKVDAKASRCNSLINLGQVYLDMEEYELAREYLEKGLDQSENLDYASGRLFARCILARLEFIVSEIDEAERLVDEVINLATSLGARRDEGIGKYLKGNVYRWKEEWEEAEKLYEEALEIFDELGVSDFKGEALYEYGILRELMGESDEAVELIEQALEIFEERSMVLWADKCSEMLEEIQG